MMPLRKFCFILFFLSFLFQATPGAAQDMVTSLLKKKLALLKNDRLEAYLDSLYLHAFPLSFEESIHHGQTVLLAAKQTEIPDVIVKATSALGQLYFEKGSVKEAFGNFNAAYALAQSCSKPTRAWMALHLGNFYKAINLLPEAQEKTQEAAILFRAVGDQRRLFNSNYFLSIIYYIENDYARAIDQANVAIENFKAIKNPGKQDSAEFISAHNTVGLCYFYVHDLDASLTWYNKAEQLAIDFHNPVWLGIVRWSKANLYVERKQYPEALQQILYGHRVATTYHQLSDACHTAATTAHVLTLMKRYPEAKVYLDSARLLLPHAVDDNVRLYYWQTSADLFNAEEKYKNAVFALQKLNAIRDSLYVGKEKANFERDAIRQEMEWRDAEINLLKARNDIFALEASRSKFQRNVLIASIVTFIILLIIIYNAYQNKKSSHRSLLAKNEVIERHQKELTLSVENLKITQEHLVQSEKMVSLGALTAGIAHEINNPLNFISGGVEALKIEMDDLSKAAGNPSMLQQAFNESEENIRDVLTSIGSGVQRANKIIMNLLFFSSPQTRGKEMVDIHETLEAALTILNSKLKERDIHVIKNYDTLPLILASAVQLSQVFLNIIDNAIYALGKTEEQRTLIISTTRQDDVIKISIADNGAGIPEELQRKIMDPFFTTKEIGKGTGLGLSISRGIIHSHHGSLHVVSEEGKGAEFITSLPVNVGVEEVEEEAQ
jgi:two-component system NtrC family sensor kinase